MYTNQMRLTGLSGIDTEGMIKQLMRAESMKYDRLYRQNTLLQWRQESYREIGGSLKSFQNSFLNTVNPQNSFRSAANFVNNIVSAKFLNGETASGVNVRASSTAPAGSHELKVHQLAQTDKYTSVSAVPLKTEAKFALPTFGTTGTESFTFTLNGLTRTVSVDLEAIEKNATDAANAYAIKAENVARQKSVANTALENALKEAGDAALAATMSTDPDIIAAEVANARLVRESEFMANTD